jgi:hypothetical protein
VAEGALTRKQERQLGVALSLLASARSSVVAAMREVQAAGVPEGSGAMLDGAGMVLVAEREVTRALEEGGEGAA